MRDTLALTAFFLSMSFLPQLLRDIPWHPMTAFMVTILRITNPSSEEGYVRVTLRGNVPDGYTISENDIGKLGQRHLVFGTHVRYSILPRMTYVKPAYVMHTILH